MTPRAAPGPLAGVAGGIGGRHKHMGALGGNESKTIEMKRKRLQREEERRGREGGDARLNGEEVGGEARAAGQMLQQLRRRRQRQLVGAGRQI